MKIKYQIFLCSLLCVFCLLGCGVPTISVSGKITFEDGTPLTSGEVVFALDGSEEYFAKGKIGSDGTYTLAEQVIGKQSGKSGCKKGDFKVFIAATSKYDITKNKTEVTHIIDQDYANKEKTPLKTKVPAGVYDFKIPPYKEKTIKK
ncbi:MAG: hypothetical protein LBP59_13345 [Planctomycetaceae bacterium]|jgi:hypothetical protein|nr:hypothetical protein [Planctomycetaceae bacterium]